MIRKRASAIIIQDKKLLLVSNPGLSVFWTPGGKIEENESVKHALKRELAEELNIVPTKMTKFFFYMGEEEDRSGHHFFPTEEHCYLVKFEGELKASAEIGKTHWFTRTEMEQNNPEVMTSISNQLLPKLIAEDLV